MSVYVDIEKKLGSFSLKVRFEAENEVLALLGASGCGKSMTLKCIAGIEKPDRGRIEVDGVTLFDSDKRIDLSPQERRVGLLFQNYALFPNMTVRQNIRAGAKRDRDKARQEAAVEEAMAGFGLGELAERYPRQLSGGQQQRVALARILVSRPNVLLLDEPFSALDSHLRFRLEREVRSVIRAFGKTVLLVSHDRDEVYRMADRIAVMDHGRIEALGEKRAVFAAPGTKSGAMLTGCKNISAIKRIGDDRVYAVDWGMELSVDRLPERARFVGIRMHDVLPNGGENAFRCRVVEVIENPFSVTVMLMPVGAEHVTPIGWETDKETYAGMKAEEMDISLPAGSLLLLEDGADAE
ncbi:MAG: ATP-binding cassette domain-containing protein [Oscillospiraceae bacterium]|nr:ATP-binding cassette domain-containing protein [Oscillospiraceae bacterium]